MGADILDDLGKRILDPTGVSLILAATVVVVYVLALLFWAVRRRAAIRSFADPAAQRVPTWATPKGRSAFIAAAAMFAVSIWLVAWLLIADKRAFLNASEWQVQPVYLLAHFATLRLFASIFTFNFLAGASHLEITRSAAVAAVNRLLGVPALLVGVLLALPFIAFDLRYFLSDRYTKLSGTATPLPADWLMFGVWATEWAVNGIIWMLLVGFLWLNVRTLKQYGFRAPIQTVLHQRHYRPFLRMSAQGATVMVVFSLVTAAYIWHAGGELTDYLGLILTTLLLAVSFIPPWLLVRGKIKAIVASEIAILQGAISQTTAEGLLSTFQDQNAPRRDGEALALLRLMHLDQLNGNIGQREAKDVALRLLAPAATVGWQVWQNSDALIAKVRVWLRLLGA